MNGPFSADSTRVPPSRAEPLLARMMRALPRVIGWRDMTAADGMERVRVSGVEMSYEGKGGKEMRSVLLLSSVAPMPCSRGRTTLSQPKASSAPPCEKRSMRAVSASVPLLVSSASLSHSSERVS